MADVTLAWANARVKLACISNPGKQNGLVPMQIKTADPTTCLTIITFYVQPKDTLPTSEKF